MIYDENSFLQGIAVGRSMKGISVVVYEGGSGGSGGETSTPKQVNFIDYDGTILYSYSAEEAQALQSLPENPSHDGLTAQGWNWTLQQIKERLTALPDSPVWVGQMYITQSGDTEIDVRMPDGRLSPILTICVNGTITVDWGDNTTADTVTGSSLTTRLAVPHTYATSGNYMMKIHAVSGSFTFNCISSYTILRKSINFRENQVYTNCVQAVRLGSGITSIGSGAFEYCYSLTSITIPNSITIIEGDAFECCYSLTSITIPNSVVVIGGNTFSYCNRLTSIAIPNSVEVIGAQAFLSCCSLASITIPNSVTSIGNNMFFDCHSLASIIIPSNITIIGESAFYDCRILASITIPNSVRSIGSSAFYACHSLTDLMIPNSVTSIGSETFSYCYSLASIMIPSSVTSIGDDTFYNCSGIAEYHIKPTTPPTLGSTVFRNISSDCVIYVPAASLSAYQTASGWSSYASYMQGE